MRKCPRCSTFNADEDSVCGICGGQLSDATPIATEEADKVAAPPLQRRTIEEIPQTWMARTLHECPYCHKRHAAKLVSKQQVDASQLRTTDVPYPRSSSRARIGGERPEPDTHFYVNYQLTYRCNQCGKEWGRLSEEEFVSED